MVEIQDKEFIDVVPIILFQNSSWIIGTRIYRKWRTHIFLSSSTALDFLFSTRSRIDRVYTHIKIASNTKINHIMVSSTDLYNDISIDRLPSKSKIRNDSCYFNNSLWWKLEFSSTLFDGSPSSPQLQRIGFSYLKKLPFFIKWLLWILVLKRMLEHFLKISPLKNFKTEKKNTKLIQKKKMFKEKMKPMIEKFQDQFYQLENKQAKGAKRCANITWELDGEKCLKKIFWKYLKDRICRIKEDLNYMPMIKNQNILATWRTFSNQKTYFMKDFTPTPQLPKLLLLHFLAKCLTLRKSLMKNLIFARQKYLQMRL